MYTTAFNSDSTLMREASYYLPFTKRKLSKKSNLQGGSWDEIQSSEIRSGIGTRIGSNGLGDMYCAMYIERSFNLFSTGKK